MPLTQAQLVTAVADRADMSKAEAKRALEALDEIVLEQLGNAEKVRIGGIVQLTVRVKPATKKRPALTLRNDRSNRSRNRRESCASPKT